MEFEKCELPKRAFYKKTKMYLFLTEFIESGAKCARVTNWEKEYANTASVRGSMKAATKRYNFPQIKVSTVNKEIYLINTSFLPKEEGAS